MNEPKNRGTIDVWSSKTQAVKFKDEKVGKGGWLKLSDTAWKYNKDKLEKSLNVLYDEKEGVITFMTLDTAGPAKEAQKTQGIMRDEQSIVRQNALRHADAILAIMSVEKRFEKHTNQQVMDAYFAVAEQCLTWINLRNAPVEVKQAVSGEEFVAD